MVQTPEISHATDATAREKRFDWPLCYEAEEFILGELAEFTSRNSFARELERRMREETGTLLIDWVDHLLLAPGSEARLRDLGFSEEPSHQTILWHPEAMLPRVLIPSGQNANSETVLTIRVESISDFMAAHG